MLVQFPKRIALYRAIYKMAAAGTLTGGFLWLKDLAFPYRGTGLGWVWNPAETGISWVEWAGYMTLPIVMVASQYALLLKMSPQQDDE